MKHELCILSTVFNLLLLLIISGHTAALRVYRNNEYEVSEIDKRIEIPRPPEQITYKHYGISHIQPRIRNRRHRHVIRRQRVTAPWRHQHRGLKRQEIIHALTEDNDKIDPEDDIESLGRRIDETGNEIKEIKPSIESGKPDKHAAAATKYIISKIKEIQEKLFKRTGNKALEEKLNQMAEIPPVKDEKGKNTTTTASVNVTMNVTAPTATSANKTVASNKKEANDTSGIKYIEDSSKPPERRKIIPEEVVDKILEKFQQLKQEAKHMASASRHSVERTVDHAEEAGTMRKEKEGMVSVEVSKAYDEEEDDAQSSFSIPLSSIKSRRTSNPEDIQIPLRVFADKSEKGDHKAVIGVPILYVKQKYYLIPAFGSLNSYPVRASLSTSSLQDPSNNHIRAISKVAYFAGKSPDTDYLPARIPQIYRKYEYKNVSVQSTMPYFDGHTEKTFLGSKARKQSAAGRTNTMLQHLNGNPTPTVYQKALLTRAESKIPRSSKKRRRQRKEITQQTDIPVMGNNMEYLNPRTFALDNARSVAHKKSDGSFKTSSNMDTLTDTSDYFFSENSNTSSYDDDVDRKKRQLPVDNRDRAAQTLIDKFVNTPDLSSVADELQLAGSKDPQISKGNFQAHGSFPKRHHSKKAPAILKTVSGDRRTFFDLNDFSRSEDSTQGYQDVDQLSEGEAETASILRGSGNAYPTLGEAKDLRSTLNEFLGENSPVADMTTESIPHRRVQQESSYRTRSGFIPSHSPNNRDLGSSELTYHRSLNSGHPQRNFGGHARNYFSVMHDNSNMMIDESTPLPQVLPDKVGNIQEMTTEDVNGPLSKRYQATNPGAVDFGMQGNLAGRNSPDDIPMIADREIDEALDGNAGVSNTNNMFENVNSIPSEEETSIYGTERVSPFGLKEGLAYRNSPSIRNTQGQQIASEFSQHTHPLEMSNIDIEQNREKGAALYRNSPGIDFEQQEQGNQFVPEHSLNDHMEQDARIQQNSQINNKLFDESENIRTFAKTALGNPLQHRYRSSNNNHGSMQSNVNANDMYGGYPRESSSNLPQFGTFQQIDPSLSENIEALQEQTGQMEREYQRVADNTGDKRTDMSSEIPRPPVNFPGGFHKTNVIGQEAGMGGDFESNLSESEEDRENAIMEVNRFAGSELTSTSPRIDNDHGYLGEKSPDQLLDYARKNILHNSIKYNRNFYGIGVPRMNPGIHSPEGVFTPMQMPSSQISVMSPSDLALSGEKNIDASTGMRRGNAPRPNINGAFPISKPDINGIYPIPDEDAEFHNPAEYLMDILHTRQRLVKNQVPVPSKLEEENGQPRDQLGSLQDNLRYEVGRLGNLQNDLGYDVGSLAEVTGGNEAADVVASNVMTYGNTGMEGYSQEVENPDFRSENFYDRDKIPRPGENITSFTRRMRTDNNITSPNETTLLESIYNTTQDIRSYWKTHNVTAFHFNETVDSNTTMPSNYIYERNYVNIGGNLARYIGDDNVGKNISVNRNAYEYYRNIGGNLAKNISGNIVSRNGSENIGRNTDGNYMNVRGNLVRYIGGNIVSRNKSENIDRSISKNYMNIRGNLARRIGGNRLGRNISGGIRGNINANSASYIGRNIDNSIDSNFTKSIGGNFMRKGGGNISRTVADLIDQPMGITYIRMIGHDVFKDKDNGGNHIDHVLGSSNGIRPVVRNSVRYTSRDVKKTVHDSADTTDHIGAKIKTIVISPYRKPMHVHKQTQAMALVDNGINHGKNITVNTQMTKSDNKVSSIIKPNRNTTFVIKRSSNIVQTVNRGSKETAITNARGNVSYISALRSPPQHYNRSDKHSHRKKFSQQTSMHKDLQIHREVPRVDSYPKVATHNATYAGAVVNTNITVLR